MTKYINMHNKIARLVLTICLFLLVLPLRAAAAEQLWDEFEMPDSRQKPRLLDEADLLSDSEEKSLLETLDGLSEMHSCNITVLTVDDHFGPIQDYADDYFDYNGFAADYNGSGILFMLSMFDREWAISTSGDAIYAFTDYGQDYMFNQMRDDLGDGDYYGAFMTYTRVCDKFLSLYEEGTPFDVSEPEPDLRTASDYIRYLVYSVIIGFVLALLPILKMKADLRTVHMNASASGYEAPQGMNIRVKSDRLVNKTVSKTPLPKDDGDSGRSGGGGWSGGSSTHTSSSGSTHGGSHGHF